MSDGFITPRHAWQPLTPRGVAAYAPASFFRVMVLQLLAGLLVGGMVIWFLLVNWVPVFREVVQRLPASAAIGVGTLAWPTNAPEIVVENQLFAIIIDPNQSGKPRRSPSDVMLHLDQDRFSIGSLLGVFESPYPRDLTLGLSRAEAVPWWGAREWPTLGLIGIGICLAMMLSWSGLALLYCPITLVFARMAKRKLDVAGAWKLNCAALMPGTLMVVLAILAYGCMLTDLIHLGLFYLLHFVAGWIFIGISPFFLPKDTHVAANPFSTDPPASQPAGASENPFAPSEEETAGPQTAANPFAAPVEPEEQRKEPARNPFAPPEDVPRQSRQPQNPFAAPPAEEAPRPARKDNPFAADLDKPVRETDKKISAPSDSRVAVNPRTPPASSDSNEIENAS